VLRACGRGWAGVSGGSGKRGVLDGGGKERVKRGKGDGGCATPWWQEHEKTGRGWASARKHQSRMNFIQKGSGSLLAGKGQIVGKQKRKCGVAS